MPFVEITTSVEVSDANQKSDIIRQASALVAEHLGKPVGYVMVALSDGASLALAGTTDPCACVDVRSIGRPTPEQAAGLCQALCSELERGLCVPPSRIFVIFTDVPRALWGLNGKMLG